MAEVGTLTYRLDIDDNGFDRQLDDSREKVKDLGDEAKKTDKKTSQALGNISKGALRDLKDNFNVTRLVIRDTGDTALKSFTRVSKAGKEVVVTQRDIANANAFLRQQVTRNIGGVIGAFDNFGRRTRRAGDDVSSFRRELAQAASVTRSLQVAFSGFRGSALIGAVTLGVGVLIELAGAAVVATGAILALPAAGAVAAGVFATVKVAAIGMGDAFKAIADNDAEKLQEALVGLSPAARRFVLAARDVANAFQPIRAAVQEALFTGLDRQLTQLASSALPVARIGLLQVADSLNRLAVEAARTVREPFFKGLLRESLGGSAQAIDTLRGAVSPLVEVMYRLVRAGMPFIQQLAAYITGGLQAAAAFLRTESGMAALQQRINAGVGVLSQLGGLLSALGSALVNLFAASEASGQTLIQTLTEMVTRFNEFATSAEGKESLQNFFRFANQVLKETLIIIGAVAAVVLSVINTISALPQPVQDVIARMTALGIVMTPLVLGLATFTNSLIALRPVLIFTGRIALQAGVFLLRFAAQALLAGTRVALAFLIATGPIGIIIAAVALLAVIVFFNFNRIRDFIMNTWRNISRFLSGVWSGIRSGAVAAFGGIISFVSTIPNRLRGALGNVRGLLFNAGRDMLNGLGNGIQSAVRGVQNRLREFASGALNTIKSFFGIRSPSRVMAEVGGFMMEGLARGIQRNTAQAIGAAKNASEGALSALSGGTVQSPSLTANAATALRATPSTNFETASASSSAASTAQPVVIQLHMNGIMTRSRADQRAVAKEMLESVNEELRARRLPEIGNGVLAV